MSIAEEYGCLIEFGEIEGFTYEVRNPAYPMVHVYCEVDGKLYQKTTQKGGMSVEGIVRMLISEMPRAEKLPT